jgi:hypothetical protein
MPAASSALRHWRVKLLRRSWAPLVPVKTSWSSAEPVNCSRCSMTSGGKNGGMLTQRMPDADLGGPVTSTPFVSSTTATSMRTRSAVMSMCLRRRAASSPQARYARGEPPQLEMARLSEGWLEAVGRRLGSAVMTSPQAYFSRKTYI